MQPDETYVIELTAAGRAAVAVVLVAGAGAVDAVEACFVSASGRRLVDAPVGRILVGRWGGGAGEELVVCRRAVDRVEVHCHGGAAAVRGVTDLLVARGCQQVSWRDWLQATEADPIQAAAKVALAEAPTARTAAILLDQLNGALVTAVRAAIDAIMDERWPVAADTLDRILAYRELGLHLTLPWRVVLAGPPNVGKSSLMNALAGFQRAIVSPVPGTTRDVVTLSTAIDGWPVQLSDTAGLREAGDEIEAAGVELAASAIENSDLVILVEDCTSLDGRSTERFRGNLQCSNRVLRVLNKVDLLSTAAHAADTVMTICTSATTGEGISELILAIGKSLAPHPPAPAAAVPFEASQVVAFEDARGAVERRDGDRAMLALHSLVGSSTAES